MVRRGCVLSAQTYSCSPHLRLRSLTSPTTLSLLKTFLIEPGIFSVQADALQLSRTPSPDKSCCRKEENVRMWGLPGGRKGKKNSVGKGVQSKVRSLLQVLADYP